MSNKPNTEQDDDPYGKVFSLSELHSVEVKIRNNVDNEAHEAAKQEAIDQFGLVEPKSKGKQKSQQIEPEIPPAPPAPTGDGEGELQPETPIVPPNPFAE